MSKFSVKTGNVKGEVDSLKGIALQLNDSRAEVQRIASSVAISGAAYSIIKKSLNDAVDNLDELKRNTESMKSGLSDIVKLYATTEAKMTAKKISQKNNTPQKEYSYLVAQYEYSYSEDNIEVPIDVRFLNKKTCLDMAERIIAEYGENGTCNGMNKKRIAKELYAHAIGYYSASTLEKMGIDGDFVQGVKESGETADIGLGDGLDVPYNIIWNIFNS